MAIANFSKSSAAPPPTGVEREILSNSRYQSSNLLNPQITEIEGEPWEGTWYSNRLVEGQEPRYPDLALDPTLQQYQKIIRFKVALESPIDPDMAPTTGTIELRAAAQIYSGTVIPKVSDVFVVQLTPGRFAAFVVTEVQPVSYFNKPTYRINLSLHTEDPNVIENMDSKVVENLVFDYGRFREGKESIRTYVQANSELQLHTVIRTLISALYDEFYDTLTKTFVMDDDSTSRLYDPIAVAFFNKVVGRELRGGKPRPEVYYDGRATQYLERPTLWRALAMGTSTGMAVFPRSFSRLDPTFFREQELWFSLASAGVGEILTCDSWKARGGTENPYVLSNEFYTGDSTMSSLEALVLLAIDRGNILSDNLATEINALESTDLTTVERFHRTILLICLTLLKTGER